jgi:hypothetical protein
MSRTQRQTGKTYRMLIRAFSELIKGHDVVVVAHNQTSIPFLVHRFAKDLCDLTSTKITTLTKNQIVIQNNHQVTFVSQDRADFDVKFNSLCGSNVVTIYDHAVLECTYKHLLDQWLIDTQE